MIVAVKPASPDPNPPATPVHAARRGAQRNGARPPGVLSIAGQNRLKSPLYNTDELVSLEHWGTVGWYYCIVYRYYIYIIYIIRNLSTWIIFFR